ncbi:hypothetical protein JXA47_16640 [Candidatus Sumerlaeota bacterium]|nr:hypothetical protein [Candidatus Sumerlaeota bacterium]
MSPEEPISEELPSEPRGLRFNLRELILVAALIALVLAAMTPWYQQRRDLTLVSQVKADLRSLATALEAYFIDDMNGPGCALAEGPVRVRPDGSVVPMPWSAHHHLPEGSGARRTITFLAPNPNYGGVNPHSLTTPIAYISALPPDPFADTPGATYGFYQEHISSHITWSVGPDRDENADDGPGDIGPVVEIVFTPDFSNQRGQGAQPEILDLLYDPTNGIRSNGDIARGRDWDWPGR